MNIVLFSRQERDQDRIHLSGRRAEHLIRVLNVQTGREIQIGELGGRKGAALVRLATAERIELQITHLDQAPPPALAVRLILALPRPKVLSRVLKAISQLGVKDLALINAARVEKPYWSAAQLSESAIQESLLLGLEQAGDTVVPQVRLEPRFRPFVEDELKNFQGETAGWVAHPYAKQPLPPLTPCTLAIGPEGGWVDFELELFKQQGFQSGSMGERILSVETALPALLGARLL